MKKRNILVMVLLTIVTVGIYIIVWSCLFQADLKKKTGKGVGPVAHLLLAIVTLGIYAIIWQYSAGKRLAIQKATDYSIMYLIFVFIGLAWLNPFIMQYQANGLKR